MLITQKIIKRSTKTKLNQPLMVKEIFVFGKFIKLFDENVFIRRDGHINDLACFIYFVLNDNVRSICFYGPVCVN